MLSVVEIIAAVSQGIEYGSLIRAVCCTTLFAPFRRTARIFVALNTGAEKLLPSTNKNIQSITVSRDVLRNS